MSASPSERWFSRARTLLVAVAMVGLPLLMWLPVAMSGWLWFVAAFLVPVPAWLLSARFLRFDTPILVDEPADDWGVRWGRPWVRIGHRTHWVSRAQMEALSRRDAARASESVQPSLTHQGFVLEVPAPHHGMPNQAFTDGLALAALMVPTLVALAVWVGLTLFTAPADLGPVVASALYGTLCSLAGHGILLAPWAFAELLVRASVQGWERPTEVRLEGRTVQVGDQTFALGQEGQTIRQDCGTLVLENARQRLVIQGAAAHLAFLHEAFERASRHTGTTADVPDALRRLHGKVGQPG
ncbi:MAG: hypothetical protein R3F61_17630 [Myxococcota bacterium]